MTIKTKKNKLAGSVVAAAFLGAFASRWIDQALKYPFPIDVILLVLSGIILYFIAYNMSGNLLNED